MFKTKSSCIISLVIILALVISLMIQRAPWWVFVAFFFGYMSVFSNLMALLIASRNTYAERTLIKCAYIFGILAVISIIVVIVLWLCL
ncbi:MAG: hypothetical protein K2J78_06250 [Muribaculaceae bacterium]|nr:hypothetical protein [Muribaculaceae bacterium]